MTKTIVNDILSRGVANVIPGKKQLEKSLLGKKKMNIYMGIDPTFTKIHLGHTVPLRKLQLFMELGHKVTFLIGDFTALIGDTSDKDNERPVLTEIEIETNFETYKNQASKILDFSKINVVHNSQWLGKLNFSDIVKLARHFSLNDFISRELIKKRLESGCSVSLPEVLYPVMQGYDSYYLDTDLQVGGTDQTFNMQAGRTLIKDLRKRDSFVLTTVFLEGTDGRKMSKSWGNAIWIEDSANEIFGKVMSLRDELISQYLLLGTNLPLERVQKLSEESKNNPMEVKKQLAFQIVTELHSKSDAQKAQVHFENTFQKRNIKDASKPLRIKSGTNIVDAISKIVGSKSQAKRLVQEGAVDINDKKVNGFDEKPKSGDIIKVGNKRFYKII